MWLGAALSAEVARPPEQNRVVPAKYPAIAGRGYRIADEGVCPCITTFSSMKTLALYYLGLRSGTG